MNKICVCHFFLLILRPIIKKIIMGRPTKAQQAAKAAEKEAAEAAVKAAEQAAAAPTEAPTEQSIEGKTCADCTRGKREEYHGIDGVRCPLRPFLQRARQQACPDCQL